MMHEVTGSACPLSQISHPTLFIHSLFCSIFHLFLSCRRGRLDAAKQKVCLAVSLRHDWKTSSCDEVAFRYSIRTGERTLVFCSSSPILALHRLFLRPLISHGFAVCTIYSQAAEVRNSALHCIAILLAIAFFTYPESRDRSISPGSLTAKHGFSLIDAPQ